MAQFHEIDQATDRETSCTGSWVLDTGVTEHGAPLPGVSGKDGVNDGLGRLIGGNERVREHRPFG